MDKSNYLPLVASEMINRVVCISPRWANILVSAVRARIDVDMIIDDQQQALDRNAMDALAAQTVADIGRVRSARPEKIFPQIDNIARIDIMGTLTRRHGLDPVSGFTGYDGIKAKLVAALDDDSIDGILVDCDSGGGTVSQMLDIADLIFAANQRNGGKPIWAMANEQMCSAAYIICSGADKIFTTRSAEIGSIGCMFMHADRQEQLAMQGVKLRAFRSVGRKAEINAFEDMSPEAVADIQQLLDETHEQLADTVARNRSRNSTEFGKIKDSIAKADGLTYIGDHARDMGFADQTASEDQVWEMFTQYLA